MSRTVGLRNWLTLNKVFFETVAAVLLSVMAITISYLSYRTSLDQAKLLRLQNELALQQLKPHFIARVEFFTKPNDLFAEDRLIIDNEGAITLSIDADVAVFFDPEFIDRNQKKRTAVVPVLGYYPYSFRSAEGNKGRIATFGGHQNDKLAADIKREFRALALHRQGVAHTMIRRYLRLMYQDLLGNSCTEYYFVEPFAGARRLEQKEGEKYFQDYRGGKIEAIELSKLTANKLFGFLE